MLQNWGRGKKIVTIGIAQDELRLMAQTVGSNNGGTVEFIEHHSHLLLRGL